MIIKQIRDLKVDDLFVCDYRGSAYKSMSKPPRDKVKQIIEKGIMTVVGGDTLVDHYLHEHTGFVYVVEPFFNDGGRFDFKWA